MSRKLAAVIIGIAVLAFAGNVFAGEQENTVVRPVSAYLDTVAKHAFLWNEIPWLYIEDGNLNGPAFSRWYAPGNYGTTNYYIFSEYDTDGESKKAWLTPDAAYGVGNSYNWSDIRVSGTWTAEGYRGGGARVNSETTFNVGAAPEPISSALFLLGGGALVVMRYRRKKLTK